MGVGLEPWVERVRALLVQELSGFGEPVELTLRVDETTEDRSVFAVARLPGDRAAFVRVYEADLDKRDSGELRIVYAEPKDVSVLRVSLGSGPTRRTAPVKRRARR